MDAKMNNFFFNNLIFVNNILMLKMPKFARQPSQYKIKFQFYSSTTGQMDGNLKGRNASR